MIVAHAASYVLAGRDSVLRGDGASGSDLSIAGLVDQRRCEG